MRRWFNKALQGNRRSLDAVDFLRDHFRITLEWSDASALSLQGLSTD